MAPERFLNTQIALQNELSTLTEHELEIQGRRDYTVYSPIDGNISSVQVKLGQTVGSGSLILFILPHNSQLEANVYVPSHSIGFLKKGQEVKIRYAAFPYQRYGIYRGRVKSIEKNILTPSDLAAVIHATEPMYKVIVALDEQSIQSYSQQWPLQPGMALEADIVLEKHSILRWVLDPIYSLRGKLM